MLHRTHLALELPQGPLLTWVPFVSLNLSSAPPQSPDGLDPTGRLPVVRVESTWMTLLEIHGRPLFQLLAVISSRCPLRVRASSWSQLVMCRPQVSYVSTARSRFGSYSCYKSYNWHPDIRGLWRALQPGRWPHQHLALSQSLLNSPLSSLDHNLDYAAFGVSGCMLSAGCPLRHLVEEGVETASVGRNQSHQWPLILRIMLMLHAKSPDDYYVGFPLGHSLPAIMLCYNNSLILSLIKRSNVIII